MPDCTACGYVNLFIDGWYQEGSRWYCPQCRQRLLWKPVFNHDRMRPNQHELLNQSHNADVIDNAAPRCDSPAESDTYLVKP